MDLIREWTGQAVAVVLRVGGGFPAHKQSTLEGKLLNVSETGLLLELPKEKTFVPVSAILHVSLSEGK